MADSARKDDSGCTLDVSAAVQLNTSELASTEGRIRWAHTLESTYCEMDVDWPRRSGQFVAELAARPLDELTVSVVRAEPHTVVRTPEMIRSHPGNDYLLCLITRGSAVITQQSRSAKLQDGAFGIIDAGEPFVVEGTTNFEQVVVRAPRAMLSARLPEEALASAVGVGVPASGGVGAVVSRFLVDISTEGTQLFGRSAVSVATSAVDLIAAAIGDVAPALSPTQRIHRHDLEAVQRAMERDLHDPDLSAGQIGVALGMSVRYVHKLFSTVGTTPRVWLYQTRLDRARQLLLGTGLTVAEVGFRVGFRDTSHFSRVFRQRFGVSPAQSRTRRDA